MKKILNLLLLGCLLVWAGGFFLFLGHIPAESPTHYPKADAIVVLTGGKGRLHYALKLLAHGRAEKLLISGVGYGVHLGDLLSRQPLTGEAITSAQEKSSDISLGYMAYSTATNASETRKWMEKNHFHSILLVTASYHMARSVFEFSALMPEITIYEAPVIPDDFHIERWWEDKKTLKLVVMEYHKYIAARFRQLLFPLEQT